MDNPAHKAIDFILTNASKFAQAKATRVQLEEFRKSKKAMLMADEKKAAPMPDFVRQFNKKIKGNV